MTNAKRPTDRQGALREFLKFKSFCVVLSVGQASVTVGASEVFDVVAVYVCDEPVARVYVFLNCCAV